MSEWYTSHQLPEQRRLQFRVAFHHYFQRMTTDDYVRPNHDDMIQPGSYSESDHAAMPAG